MAFKGGSQIQAGLGAANFSPIVQGGIAQGNAYANIGNTLAGAAMQAIQTYQQKKQEKVQLDAAQKYFESQGMVPDEVKAMIKGVGIQNVPALIGQMEQQQLRESAIQRESQRNAQDVSAALLSLQTAYPATKDGQNQFDSTAYLEGFRNAGGQDISVALKVLDYGIKTGEVSLPEKPMSPQEEAELAKTRAEAEKLTAEAGDIKAKAGQAKPNKYQEKLAETYAVQAAAWNTGGGIQSLQNINELNGVVQGLASGRIKTDTFWDNLPVVSEYARSVFNETGVEATDRVRGVAYQSLRDTLGAQFTEREGEKLVSTYFNPRLNEAENIRRLKSLVGKLKVAHQAKDAIYSYYAQNGSMDGFTGMDQEQVEQMVREEMLGNGSSYVTAGGLKVEVIEE